MLFSLSAFAKKTSEGRKIDSPKAVSDQELISTAVTIYKDVPGPNSQKMGKSKACYARLYPLTFLYCKLTAE